METGLHATPVSVSNNTAGSRKPIDLVKYGYFYYSAESKEVNVFLSVGWLPMVGIFVHTSVNKTTQCCV